MDKALDDRKLAMMTKIGLEKYRDALIDIFEIVLHPMFNVIKIRMLHARLGSD